MRLRDVCPCSVTYIPDLIYTSGMSVVCSKGHRVILSFNYIPEVLRKKEGNHGIREIEASNSKETKEV